MNRRNSRRVDTGRTVSGSGMESYRTPWGIVNDVRSAEWVAFFYFLYLAGVCWLRPLPASRRLFVTAVSLLTAAAAVAASRAPVARPRVGAARLHVSSATT